jgi:hypothetical protein
MAERKSRVPALRKQEKLVPQNATYVEVLGMQETVFREGRNDL